uniref:Uncharacterized protein n=1 Tax=Rhizophora mucronata TaxID=61149 RepID=A0A2P2KMU0_RHIMU
MSKTLNDLSFCCFCHVVLKLVLVPISYYNPLDKFQ